MSLIAVDLTPVLPGGENGGAKILAIELLKSFQKMAPADQFLLLTASWNHEELAILDGQNMSRLCVLKREQARRIQLPILYFRGLERRLRRVYSFIQRRFPPSPFGGRLLRSRGVDLLFCPFTAPTYAEPGIPVVSLIHDLQHRTYPQFFSAQEIDNRDTFFYLVKKTANSIICVSEYVRQGALSYLNTTPETTYAVPNCIQGRLTKLAAADLAVHLTEIGIDQHRYMFYPANFWPHKNHRMLLAAYGIFVARNPGEKIDLVLTGGLAELQEELKDATKQMNLIKRVHFLGFLPQEKFISVWQGCEFLIFPSLYEGFGIPVIEAMSMGKPVMCSNTTSLPEVAGDAALYFDPRKPEDIVSGIEKMVTDPGFRNDLVSRGYHRVKMFRSEDMTNRYLEIFRSAMKNAQPLRDEVVGVFDDGWTGEEIHIRFRTGGKNRFLQLRLEAPSFLPARRVQLELQSKNTIEQRWTINRGKEITIQLPLPEQEGYISLLVQPTFQPSAWNLGSDIRNLGVMCHEFWMISPAQGRRSLLRGKS